MDSRFAAVMGLEGRANAVAVEPREGAGDDEVKRSLAGIPGVVSVQPVRATTDALKDVFDEFVGVLRVVQGIVLLLALLIAFNSTSINMDERAREHATMFAFGVRIRTAIAMAIAESLMIGVVATAAGVLAGYLIVGLMINVLIADTLPDLGMIVSVSGQTLATAVVLGVVAMAAAPLLTLRRLRRMNIAATLKVIE
jgi:putative ABC transport system permease protein